jgi:hypothetical protein
MGSGIINNKYCFFIKKIIIFIKVKKVLKLIKKLPKEYNHAHHPQLSNINPNS